MSMYESDLNLKAITCEKIVAAVATDEECRTLADLVQNGFPKLHNDLPPIDHIFWPMKYTCLEGILIKGNKILIHRQLRAEVLESLHSTHQGVNGMQVNTRQRLFWPGLGASVRQTRAQCRICNSIALQVRQRAAQAYTYIRSNPYRQDNTSCVLGYEYQELFVFTKV